MDQIASDWDIIVVLGYGRLVGELELEGGTEYLEIAMEALGEAM
jgi:hypothetical protein